MLPLAVGVGVGIVLLFVAASAREAPPTKKAIKRKKAKRKKAKRKKVKRKKETALDVSKFRAALAMLPKPEPKTAVFQRAEEHAYDVFSSATATTYPAPYRLVDAKKIVALVMLMASETSPHNWPHYQGLKGRVARINASGTSEAERVYNLIHWVVLPAFAANLFWHWFRPRSPTKESQYTAIVTWTLMFFVLPQTATVAVGTSIDRAYSSWPKWDEQNMRVLSPLERAPSLSQVRRSLLDTDDYIRTWPEKYTKYRPGDGSSLGRWMVKGAQQLRDVLNVYPETDSPRIYATGNLKIMGQIVWLMQTRVARGIDISELKAMTYPKLVMKVVAAVATAASAFVSPAIGVMLAAAVTGVGTIARMLDGETISSKEAQAIGGAAVTSVLEDAAIHLELESELETVKEAASKAKRVTS